MSRSWASLLLAVGALAAPTACSSEHECLERSANEGAGNLGFHTSSETFALDGGYAQMNITLKNYSSAQDAAAFGSFYEVELESKPSELMFHAPPPWRLSSKLGPEVILELVQRRSEICMTAAGEPRPIIETVLRKPTGELLALGAYSVPTLRDGTIPLATETLREIQKLEWVDVDCARSMKDFLEERRVVALKLTTREGTSVVALPGERAEVVVGQDKYVFAPSSAFRSTDGDGCAFAGFVLYRPGVLVDMAD